MPPGMWWNILGPEVRGFILNLVVALPPCGTKHIESHTVTHLSVYVSYVNQQADETPGVQPLCPGPDGDACLWVLLWLLAGPTVLHLLGWLSFEATCWAVWASGGRYEIMVNSVVLLYSTFLQFSDAGSPSTQTVMQESIFAMDGGWWGQSEWAP